MKVTQSCPILWYPMDYTVHGILQARILEWVAFPFSRDLPNPGIEPRSPTLQVVSLPVEPQGEPKNTGVSSLSLLRWRSWEANSRMEPGSSALQMDSLSIELSGEPYFYFLTMSYFMSQDFIQDTFHLIMISLCLFSLL